MTRRPSRELLAANTHRRRVEQQKTKAEVARKLDVSASVLTDIEQGQARDWLDLLDGLSAELDVQVWELFDPRVPSRHGSVGQQAQEPPDESSTHEVDAALEAVIALLRVRRAQEKDRGAFPPPSPLRSQTDPDRK